MLQAERRVLQEERQALQAERRRVPEGRPPRGGCRTGGPGSSGGIQRGGCTWRWRGDWISLQASHFLQVLSLDRLRKPSLEINKVLRLDVFNLDVLPLRNRLHFRVGNPAGGDVRVARQRVVDRLQQFHPREAAVGVAGEFFAQGHEPFQPLHARAVLRFIVGVLFRDVVHLFHRAVPCHPILFTQRMDFVPVAVFEEKVDGKSQHQTGGGRQGPRLLGPNHPLA